MITETIKINNDENVTLTTYIQAPSEEMKHAAIKPAILIFPGGGYQFISDREGEVVALEYLKAGYQCFILTYSINEHSKFPRPLEDAEAALNLIKNNHKKWYLDADKIAVIGFSAGAHLAMMLAGSGRVRPNAVIAGYPALYPIPDISYDFELPKIDKKSPEAFIFHTFKDGFVKVENSLYLADQYHKQQIPFELHVFRDGDHGMSLGNESVKNEWLSPDKHYHHWVELSIEWLERVLSPQHEMSD